MGATAVPDRYELMAQVRGAAGGGAGASVVGTPDQLVAMVRNLQQVTGGFGTVLGFAHDWANREATLRSWELFARYVIPELNGYTANQKVSAEFLAAHQAELMKGRAESIRATVKGNEKAQAALEVTMKGIAAAQNQAGGFRPGSLPPMDEGKKEKVGSDD
jgi:limonene 1,2-monooxygenase